MLYRITKAFIAEFEALVRTVRNVNGPGVRVDWGRGITITPAKPRWERPPAPAAAAVVRVKVTTANPGGSDTLALVQRWDGTALSGTPFPMQIERDLAVDNEAYACRPAGGVIGDPEYSGAAVTWQQIGGGIKDIRWDESLHTIQVTYVVDPDEADWVSKISADGCT